MLNLRKGKEKKERKRRIQSTNIAEVIVLIFIPLTAVNKEYALVPVSLIFVFALMMIRRIVKWQTSLRLCKNCKKERLEIDKDEE